MGNKEYELDLSIDAEPILDQLEGQGMELGPADIMDLDRMDWYRVHIVELHRNNLLTDNEAEKARERLNQKIKGIIKWK